jgi:hypothetical protein
MLLSHVSCPDLLVCCTVSKAAFQRLLTASARHTRVLVQIIMVYVAWPPGRLAQDVDREREQTAGRDRHWPNKTRRSIQALRPASCTALHSCTAQLSARAGALAAASCTGILDVALFFSLDFGSTATPIQWVLVASTGKGRGKEASITRARPGSIQIACQLPCKIPGPSGSRRCGSTIRGAKTGNRTRWLESPKVGGSKGKKILLHSCV